MRFNELLRRILFTLKRRKMDRELAEEMRQHMELKARRNIEAGMTEEEARYAAKRQLGNLTRMEEESRRSRGFPLAESFIQDIRYGLRGLWKAPGFTAVATITLALGIGATAAIFSVVNTVVLRPLPYKDANRLARIQSIVPMFPDFELGASKPDFDDIRSGVHALEGAAIFQERAINLTGPGAPEQLRMAAVSKEFIPLFGIPPAIGRGFSAEDEARKEGDVVLLSHRFWRERFGSDPNIVGQTITLERKPYSVIGVMPAGYDCPEKGNDLWSPLTFSQEESTRGNWYFNVVAKVRPKQSFHEAQRELNNLADRLAAQYPKEEAGLRFKLTPLQDQVVGNAKSELILLLGAVGFLLLIACANVSNLILSRGLQRQTEIALRLALGASRQRILRQLLIESLLLSCLGGALGVFVAVYGIDAYRALAPANVPRIGELHVDPTIAWVALVLSSLAAILCGLAPALHTSKPDLNAALKERQSSGAFRKRFSLRGSLVVVEIALALVLLDGSALMTQSMVRLLNVDAGFSTDHVLTAELTLPKSRYGTGDARRIFIQQLLNTLHTNEQLKNVALSDSSALADNLKMMMFEAGTLGAGDKSTTLQMRSVAPGYFETLHIRLIAGRLFTESDDKGKTRVVIVNEALVRRYFSGKEALGKILKFGPDADDQCQIVGIVADTRDVQLRSAPRPQVYLSQFQNPDPSVHLFLRTANDPLAPAIDIRKAVWSIDKDLPVSHVQSMTEVIAQSVAEPRFRTWLLVIFAVVGLILTLVGIYGVISYMAGQRTREIGIRVALGAQRGNVLRLVLTEGIRLAVAGSIAGVIGSLALTRLLKSQLFGIKPTDPVTLIGVAALVLLVALAACYLPARRATQVDPLMALRQE
ncbi:MAG TPA: ABC transporter permease [Candidatus Angelobacter sp.]|nr:ABC transporter permease [Candidatus Angelobacter sp.]